MFAISHCRKELVCKKKASISCMIFKHANDLFMWVNSSFLADFYSILSNEMTFLRRLCREDISQKCNTWKMRQNSLFYRYSRTHSNKLSECCLHTPDTNLKIKNEKCNQIKLIIFSNIRIALCAIKVL